MGTEDTPRDTTPFEAVQGDILGLQEEVTFQFPDDVQTFRGIPVPIPPATFSQQLGMTLAETERFEAYTSALEALAYQNPGRTLSEPGS